MVFDAAFENHLARRPAAVMVRAALGHAFAPDDLNALFEPTARQQYTRRITFSAVVSVPEAAVFNRHTSARSAYRHNPAPAPAALSPLCDKLDHAEPAVAEALARHTAARLSAAAARLPAGPQVIDGPRLKQLDGNYLAGTDHRLPEPRGPGAAALPGLALVVRADRTGPLTDPVACEDAYAQARSLIDRVRTRVGPAELWVAGRKFAVDALFAGVAASRSFFAVRCHAGAILHERTPPRAAGATDTGLVFEQRARVGKATCRSAVVRLFRPTEAGDAELRLRTNLSGEQATAAQAADAYRRRRRIGGAVLELTTSLRREGNTLGCPKAALPGFALAVAACNVLRGVGAALETAERAAAGPGDEQPWEASSHAVAVELRTAYDGPGPTADPEPWPAFAGWPARRPAAWLLRVAGRAGRRRCQKATRGPKKAAPQVKASRMAAHRSTFRPLRQRTNSPNPSPPP